MRELSETLEAPGPTDVRPAAARPERTAPFSDLRVCELKLAAKFYGQPKLDVLLDEAVRRDVCHAAFAEPLAHALDELLRCGGAGRDADHGDAFEPGIDDLGLVVDQV